MSRAWLVLGVTLAAGWLFPLHADAPERCGADAYARAVCLYHSGQLGEAAALLQEIASAAEPAPETVRSWYFLARVRMKQGRWEEASRNLVVVYRLSRSFYREWGCDYLLGQCRAALGKN